MGRTKDGIYTVNDTLLKFYHFSGFDSGAQEKMLNAYSGGNKYLYDLRTWYIDQMNQEGQDKYGKFPSIYNFYDNGKVISKEERAVIKNRDDVKEYFKNSNPFVTNTNPNYYSWYQNEGISPEVPFAIKLKTVVKKIIKLIRK